MIRKFKYGDRICLRTGEKGIFEDYDPINKRRCWIIIDPDLAAEGSRLVNIRDIRLGEREYAQN